VKKNYTVSTAIYTVKDGAFVVGKVKADLLLRIEIFHCDHFKHTFTHSVHELLRNDEMSQVILHSDRVITQERVCVAQTVTRLRLHRSISQFLC
jgi:hypothetical protein